MNEQIKSSIDARRNAFNAYDLTDKFKKEIDDLFTEINDFGASCDDVGDFETKFATSPLNQSYIDMFTKVATASANKEATKGATEQMAVNAAEAVTRDVIGSAVPTTKAAVHQKVYDAARDIPGVGNAIDIGEKASYIKHLGKMFGKKK